MTYTQNSQVGIGQFDQSGVVTDYPNATDLELHTMQFQSFWNSGWIYNVSADDAELDGLEPSSRKYSQLYDITKHNLKPDTIMDDTLLSPQDFLDLQVLWYLYHPPQIMSWENMQT